MGTAAKPAPLPARLAGLIREAKWLLLGALAVYLLLVFATYHRGDPGWSHTGNEAVRNAGGALGAWLADILLYLFGLSAYWLVALCAFAVVWGHRRLDGRSVGLALGGFALVILSSASLEGLRLHSLAVELPLAPGGLVGDVIGRALAVVLGFTGATLALLALAAVGFSLFTGFSWFTISELVGFALESGIVAARRAWERRQDRRAGELAREERELVVETEKKREEEPSAAAHRAAGGRDQEVGARAEGKAGAALRGAARHAAAAAQAARRGEEGRRAGQRRDARIHLAPDREEALRLRRRRESAGRLSRPGDHALRGRARGGREGQPGRQPGEGPGPRAVGGFDPGGGNDSRQVVHGPRDPEPAPADRAPLGDPRLRGLPRAAIRRSPLRSARTSPATRWWPISRGCRTCSSPAPPARASRWR